MRKTVQLISTVALAPLLWAQAAHAQTAPASTTAQAAGNQTTGATTAASDPATSEPTAQSTDSSLGDIIVTATKTSTNLQKTPIVIDVIGGDQIAKVGLVNIAAISNLAPALNFGQANGVYTTVTIRGVSSQDTTELGDPAVAFNIDGEYINRPLNLAASLFDIERVEVLRGPQGTLYGRNATAGAINIITGRPKFDRIRGSLSGSVGNYGQVGVNGFINVPLSDTLAVRVAGLFDRHNGYLKAQVGPDLDDSDVKAGRIRVLWEPSSKLSFIVTGEIIKSTANGPATTATAIPATAPAGSLPRDVQVFPTSREIVPGGVLNPYNNSLQKDVRAEVNWDFGFAKLTDSVGYRTTDFDFFTNIQGSQTFTTDYSYHGHYKTFGNELRLASSENFPFKWQVGYYYFNEDQNAVAPLFQGINPAVKRDYAFPRLQFNYPLVNANSNAFYGEATVPLGAGISVTGGIRHTTDKKFRVGNQQILDLATYLGTGKVQYTTVPLNGTVDNKRWTYNGVLNWQASRNSLFYAKYTTGYKSGGFTTINTYGPEDLTSYEVGTKNRFDGGKLQLNAAAFYYDYKNQQVQTFVTANGTTNASTTNAASSRVYGFEAEFVAAITPDDRFRATFDYLDAKYRNFAIAVVSVGGANVLADFSGNRAPFAPRYTIGASYAHTFHIGDGTLRAEAVTAYKSAFFLQSTNYRSQRQEGFIKTDMTLTYASPNDRFELSAFVRNLENNRTYRYSDFTSTFGQNFFRWQFTSPRTFGVRATVNY